MVGISSFFVMCWWQFFIAMIHHYYPLGLGRIFKFRVLKTNSQVLAFLSKEKAASSFCHTVYFTISSAPSILNSNLCKVFSVLFRKKRENKLYQVSKRLDSTNCIFGNDLFHFHSFTHFHSLLTVTHHSLLSLVE